MSDLIVIPDDFPPVYTGRPELDDLRALGEVRLYGERASTREQLVERLQGARFIVNVRAFTVFDEALLAALPDVQMVAVFGTGTDNFDLEAADRVGVVVTNAPGENARSVAEHVIALMFALARTIPAYDRDVRAGFWRHHEGIELEGKTLGVVGLGSIGSQVARIGEGLGLRVIAWSPSPDPARAARLRVELLELDELLHLADVVSLNVALSERSRGLIGRRELGLMKPSALLINTARGALIDEDALVEALQAGRIRGAGLDVYAAEPLPQDSLLRGLDNVVLTPHAGWVTAEARSRLLGAPIRNIQAFLAGTPRNVVNPKALAHERWT
jgi:phosphoglycerate dehydrogenase-like enzyme